MMKSKMPKLIKTVVKPKTKKGPVIEKKQPPVGANPPLPEVHFTEDEIGFDRGEYSVRDLEGMDLSDAKPEKEPWYHSHLFIISMMIIALLIMVSVTMWSMT